jgi:hypothetical protein
LSANSSQYLADTSTNEEAPMQNDDSHDVSTAPDGLNITTTPTSSIRDYVKILLVNIAQLFSTLQLSEKKGPKIVVTTYYKLMLNVLSQLSPYVDQPDLARSLVKMMLPYLKIAHRKVDEQDKMRILKVVVSCIPLCDGESCVFLFSLIFCYFVFQFYLPLFI